MKCEICGKDKNCQTWNYIIKKDGIGRARRYTPGTDTVYKTGGRETGREKDTTYTIGKVKRVTERGTAGLCMKCRILWSAVFVLGLSTLLSLIFLFLFQFMTDETAVINHFGEAMTYFLPLFFLLSLTPLMKHWILSVQLAFQKKVLPWQVLSEFWE